MGRLSSIAETIRRDPFRLFFPLGVLAGILGVGEWIFWSAGSPPFMVSFVHSTLQSQGFLAFFVVGFLLTALPRFTGTDYAGTAEVSTALAGALVLCAAVLARRWEAAQAGFLLMLAVLPVFAARRLKSRTKPFPPSFLLLAFGLVHAVAGSVLLMISRMGMAGLGPFEVGRHMLSIGFPLCMVLGVTAKLAPFLTGYAEASPRDEAPNPADGWAGKAAVHGAAGAVLLLTFAVEGAWPRAAVWLRFAVAASHLLSFARIGRFPLKRTAPALLFWTSCWMLPSGLGLMALFPAHRVAFAHVLFIGGFSLMIFSFGLLIVLTHAARADALKGPMTPLKVVGALLAAALSFRTAAEFLTGREKPLLLGASAAWVAAASLWLGYVLWKVGGPRPALPLPRPK